jgi:hypothetical protein
MSSVSRYVGHHVLGQILITLPQTRFVRSRQLTLCLQLIARIRQQLEGPQFTLSVRSTVQELVDENALDQAGLEKFGGTRQHVSLVMLYVYFEDLNAG